jgi:hypothetical protein
MHNGRSPGDNPPSLGISWARAPARPNQGHGVGPEVPGASGPELLLCGGCVTRKPRAGRNDGGIVVTSAVWALIGAHANRRTDGWNISHQFHVLLASRTDRCFVSIPLFHAARLALSGLIGGQRRIRLTGCTGPTKKMADHQSLAGCATTSRHGAPSLALRCLSARSSVSPRGRRFDGRAHGNPLETYLSEKALNHLFYCAAQQPAFLAHLRSQSEKSH